MSFSVRCDGPDCATWIRYNSSTNNGFLTVYHGHKDHDVKNRLDFCSWDCCMMYASEQEPLTTIE